MKGLIFMPRGKPMRRANGSGTIVKHTNSAKSYSQSSVICTRGAYQKCEALHTRKIREIRAGDMQAILDDNVSLV